jgi:hypothetical protein
MRANSLKFSGASGIAVLALALLLASCAKPSYKIGGTVSGLTGTGLVLQNNGGDDLAISANGAFSFSKEVKKDAGYNVTVFVQPAGQTCAVTNGTGTAKSNVTDVAVNCAGNGFTVGGTVSGLAGTGLVLQNNGGNALSISADGAFTFSTPVAAGGAYSVAVFTQPAGQGCSVANGSGTSAGANVTNVAVACAAPPGAPTVNPLAFGVKELQFSWAAVGGATFYQLLENPDGVSGFGQVATNITATNFNYTIPVHRRLNASYEVAACNSGGCTPSVAIDLGADLVRAIGYIKASNAGASDQFGFSVALSGDGNTLAVGAPNESSALTGVTAGSVDEGTAGNGASNAGAVYVFARIAGVWVQQAYVKASNTGANDAFGIAVALSGDGNTLAVGARFESSGTTGVNSTPDESAPLAGAAYVYVRSAGTWSQQAYVKASNTGFFQMFGSSVALNGDGNTLAVGAPFEGSSSTGINSTPDTLATAAGAAYVFTRNVGSWSQQAYVKSSNSEASDLFGSAVALSSDGNTLAVGAPGEDSGLTGVTLGSVDETTSGNASPGSGAVYLYARSASTWSQQAYVKASNTGDGDQFGSAVALSGDGNTLAVGAPLEDSSLAGVTAGAVNNATSGDGSIDSGAAYVFFSSAGIWSQQAFIKASNPGTTDNFGTAVALSGDGTALAVGSPLEDSGTTGIGGTPDEATADSGAVYSYVRSAGAWAQQAYVKASNTGAADQFGKSVALSNDGNALAVGAQLEDGSSTGIDGAQDVQTAAKAGAAYLY